MNRTLKTLGFALTIFVLAGCGQTVDINLAPNLTIHFSQDKSKVVSLSAQDDSYKELENWVAHNNGDWLSTAGKFSGGIYIQTGERAIQLTQKHAILYSNGKVSHIQNIAASELKTFREMLP